MKIVNVDTNNPALEIHVDGELVYRASGRSDFLNLSYMLRKAKLEPHPVEPGLQAHPILVELLNAVETALGKIDPIKDATGRLLSIPKPGTQTLHSGSKTLQPLETDCIAALKKYKFEGEAYEKYLRLMMFPWVPSSLPEPEADWFEKREKKL